MHDAVPRQRTIAVTATSDFDDLLLRSHREPVLLFKHDPYCSISAAAHREMGRVGADVAIVDVARYDRLGQAIAARTGVQHQSPQVIVLRDGRSVWSASHFMISAESVRRAVDEAALTGVRPQVAAGDEVRSARPRWKLW
ncbi:MAG: DUF2847 family protein [Chloroflexota bacterium]|nr:MAG: DUF2847 family protein [Chloroflexota bacterium]